MDTIHSSIRIARACYWPSEIKLQGSSNTAQESGSSSGPKSDTNVFASHSQDIIGKAVAELGAIDILVNNAAHQAFFKNIEDITDEEWELTFKVTSMRCFT